MFEDFITQTSSAVTNLFELFQYYNRGKLTKNRFIVSSTNLLKVSRELERTSALTIAFLYFFAIKTVAIKAIRFSRLVICN